MRVARLGYLFGLQGKDLRWSAGSRWVNVRRDHVRMRSVSLECGSRDSLLVVYIRFQTMIYARGCDSKSGSFASALKRGVADWAHGADKGLTGAAESD